VGNLPTSPPPPAARKLHAWAPDTTAELRLLHEALTGTLLSAGQSLSEIAKQMVLVATESATHGI
jgi:hypothetical protein